MGRPFPLKIPPLYEGCGPPSNAWFLRSTQTLNPNGISIVSAVLSGLTSVTDRQTDTHHAIRTLKKGRIYVRSTGDAA